MNLKINLNIFVCKFEPNKNLWSNSPEPSFLKILSRIFYLPRKYSQINYLSKNPPLINPWEYFLKYPFLQDVSNYSLKFSKNILSNSLQRIPPKYPWKNHFLSFPFFLSPSSVLYMYMLALTRTARVAPFLPLPSPHRHPPHQVWAIAQISVVVRAFVDVMRVSIH